MRPLLPLLGVLTLIASVAPRASAQDTASYQQYIEAACLHAFYRSTNTFWRAGPDTTRYTLARDSAVTPAATAARRCVAKFDIATTSPRDLLYLASAYLTVGNDSAAHRAITRRLESEASAPISTRAETLARIAALYLGAPPARLTDARTYLAQLDALSESPTVIPRLQAYSALLDYSMRAADRESMRMTSERIIAMGKQLDAHDRQEFGGLLANAHAVLIELAADSAPAAARQAIVRARADIGTLTRAIPTLTAFDSAYVLLGTRATPLQGTWYGAPATTARPAPGKFSLLVFSPQRYTMPMYRRLARTFGDTLEIVFITETVGYVGGTGPATTEKELAYLDNRIRTELAAPGPLVINVTEFDRLPDGRRVPRLSPNQRAYGIAFGISAALIDPSGTIRALYFFPDERRLEAAIRKKAG